MTETEADPDFMDVLDMLSRRGRTSPPPPEPDQHQVEADRPARAQATPEPEPSAQATPPAALEPYVSPTLSWLARVAPEQYSKVKTICASCPGAIWTGDREYLQCHCTQMHMISWSSEDPQHWQKCDGEASATADWLANQLG